MKRSIAITLSAAMLSTALLSAGCGRKNNHDHTDNPGHITESTNNTNGMNGTDRTNGTTNGMEDIFGTDGSSDGSDNSGESGSSETSSMPPGNENPAQIKPSGFEDLDFGGKTFVIATQSGTDTRWETTKEIYTDEPSAVGTSVRERNKLVELLYNCKIQVNDSEDPSGLAMAEVTSNQHNVDLFSATTLGRSPSEQGNIYNLYTLGIDFSHEWWDQTFVSTYSVKTNSGADSLYALIGDFCLSAFAATHAIFYNKNVMATSPITDNVYELVKNKEWTMDKFAEMVKLGAKETSGNSNFAYAEGDILGWVRTGHAVHGLHTASGLSIIGTENGAFFFEAADDPSAWTGVIDKAIDIWNTEGSETLGYTNVQNAVASGKALFASEVIDVLERMKNTEGVTLGLLPYPLYNNSQENYAHYVDNHVFTYHVPTSVSATEEMGRFLEVFGYHSRHTVRKAFIDVYSYEYCGDAESADMLSIILDSRTYDPGYHYWNVLEADISQMISTGQNNIAKWTERKRGAVEGDISSYITKISENGV